MCNLSKSSFNFPPVVNVGSVILPRLYMYHSVPDRSVSFLTSVE